MAARDLPARLERCKDRLCPACAETPNPSLIATRSEQAFAALVCDAPNPACPECAPVYPSQVHARCDPSRARCVVEMQEP